MAQPAFLRPGGLTGLLGLTVAADALAVVKIHDLFFVVVFQALKQKAQSVGFVGQGQVASSARIAFFFNGVSVFLVLKDNREALQPTKSPEPVYGQHIGPGRIGLFIGYLGAKHRDG
jgi:hypothetical protein